MNCHAAHTPIAQLYDAAPLTALREVIVIAGNHAGAAIRLVFGAIIESLVRNSSRYVRCMRFISSGQIVHTI